MTETLPAGAASGPSWRATVSALAVGQILNWAALCCAFSSLVRWRR